MFAKTALGGIWVYQNYLSPRKGFRCAYAVQHGGTGCSGFAKHAIRDYGLWAAIPQVRQRFRDCKAASLALRSTCAVHADQHKDEDTNPRRKKRRIDKAGWFDACSFGCCAGFPGSAATDTPAASDAASGVCSTVPDIGGCDCSPDCSCSPSCG